MIKGFIWFLDAPASKFIFWVFYGQVAGVNCVLVQWWVFNFWYQWEESMTLISENQNLPRFVPFKNVSH